MHEDFVNEEIVELEVKGFRYKPVTGADETEWMNDYIEFIDGKAVQNLSKINQCKTRNIVEVPYGKETIKKIIGIEKEWKDLSFEQKWTLLGKLKPEVLNKIMKSMNKVDHPNSEVKKKS